MSQGDALPAVESLVLVQVKGDQSPSSVTRDAWERARAINTQVMGVDVVIPVGPIIRHRGDEAGACGPQKWITKTI